MDHSAYTLPSYLLHILLGIFISAPMVAAPLAPRVISQKTSWHPYYPGHAILQLGGYSNYQGKNQHININTLIGDNYTVTNHTGSNGLVGVGYFLEGQKTNRFEMAYGLNWFYLAKTDTAGTVTQENLFTNLAYAYHVTQYPLYVVAKSFLNLPTPDALLTVDAGIGPNFMSTGIFHETSLDGDQTLPDQFFSGKTTTVFSATAGVGMKFQHFLDGFPLECGYRFFYLGQGSFRNTNNQVLSTFSTGPNYANAVMCTMTV